MFRARRLSGDEDFSLTLTPRRGEGDDGTTVDDGVDSDA